MTTVLEGVRGQRHARPLFTPGKDPVPIVQEAGWVPGPVWTGAENLTTTGIRSPDRPDRSQSLYRLRYPAHHEYICTSMITYRSVLLRMRNVSDQSVEKIKTHMVEKRMVESDRPQKAM